MNEYRIGPRSVLRPGDRFRVTDGPEWVDGDRRLSMRARGVMTFKRVTRHPSGYVYIEAHSDRDGDVVLHVSGERAPSPDLPEMTTRPYRITSRVK